MAKNSYNPGSAPGHVKMKPPKQGAKPGSKPKGLRCVSGGPMSNTGDPNFGKKAKRR